MENIDETDSNSSTITPRDAQGSSKSEQRQSINESQVGSNLESFPPGSSSESYAPSDMASGNELLQNVMRHGHPVNLDSLVSLLREQIDENKNLRQTLTDSEGIVADHRAENADLRGQLKQQEKTSQEKIEQLSKENSALKKALKKNEDSEKKIKQLENAEQKNEELFNKEKNKLNKKITDLEKKVQQERDSRNIKLKLELQQTIQFR